MGVRAKRWLAWGLVLGVRDELIVDLASCVFADRDGIISSVRSSGAGRVSLWSAGVVPADQAP